MKSSTSTFYTLLPAPVKFTLELLIMGYITIKLSNIYEWLPAIFWLLVSIFFFDKIKSSIVLQMFVGIIGLYTVLYILMQIPMAFAYALGYIWRFLEYGHF